MTLDELAIKHGTDKSSIHHNYCPRYERYFEPFRQEAFNMLEIGVSKGASIRMWLDYFQNAQVYGIEFGSLAPPDHPRYHHLHGDVRDESRWAGLPNMRLVVDDGSHLVSQIKAAFAFGWPHVSTGGLWIVEDLCAMYSPEYKDESGTIIGWAKERIDELNAHGQPTMCGNPDVDAGEIGFMHFWKSLLIIGKKPQWITPGIQLK